MAQPKSSHMFTLVFVLALLVSTAVRLWLAARQMRHVRQNRGQVPERFAGSISLSAHQKAADYTVAQTRLASIETVVEAAFLVALTLLGGLQWIDDAVARPLLSTRVGGIGAGIVFVVAVFVLSALVDVPFSLYRHFVIETRFGFNRRTFGLYLADLARNIALSALLGLPILAAVLWFMDRAGSLWWLYTWLTLVVYELVIMVVYPIWIAPVFNRFEPLADVPLRERIDALLQRCRFSARGVFVMDGSRRSAHGNAYFAGIGSAKRIVFYDTLLSRLSASEVEAVLAHELGHYKRHHIRKRLAWIAVLSLLALALLGWLAQQSWFFEGLGVSPSAGTHNAVALVLFMYVLPVFTFPLAPLMSLASRRHEYEADAFAAEHAAAADLIAALVKLYEDNASTLTPDPLHSAFYDSHPPAALRVQHLEALLA